LTIIGGRTNVFAIEGWTTTVTESGSSDANAAPFEKENCNVKIRKKRRINWRNYNLKSALEQPNYSES